MSTLFQRIGNLFSKEIETAGNKYNLGIVFDGTEKNATQLVEIVPSAAPVVWNQLDVAKLPEYKVRAQNGSSACVTCSMNLIGSILYFQKTNVWVDFSFAWTYSQRVNKPQEGTGLYDVFDLCANKGLLPDALLPSDNLSENDINSPTIYPWFSTVAEAFRLDGAVPIIIPVGDIELLASVIQTTGKPVMVWFKFGRSEWNKVPKLTADTQPYVHSVTAIPPRNKGDITFGMYQGEKAVVIQDSWGLIDNTFNGKRIITESYYKERNLLAAYPMRFKFDAVDVKPKYDGSTKSLQDCLKAEGLFPTNVVSSGFYGNITTQAVKDFQKKYGFQQVGTVGPLTSAKLHQIYG